MKIAERESSGADIVRAGVTDEDLARIVALTGLAPARVEGRPLADDHHPVTVAARIAGAAVVLRLVAALGALVVLGCLTGVVA